MSTIGKKKINEIKIIEIKNILLFMLYIINL